LFALNFEPEVLNGWLLAFFVLSQSQC